jgi:hypothetical protein
MDKEHRTAFKSDICVNGIQSLQSGSDWLNRNAINRTALILSLRLMSSQVDIYETSKLILILEFAESIPAQNHWQLPQVLLQSNIWSPRLDENF